MFSYKGTDYRGNRIPDSYESLRQAAMKIRSVVGQNQTEKVDETLGFRFFYTLPGQEKPLPITNYEELMNSLNMAFQQHSDPKNLVIKFFIEEVKAYVTYQAAADQSKSPQLPYESPKSHRAKIEGSREESD